MYAKIPNAKPTITLAKSQGLTRLNAGLTLLPTGLRVKTHIKAGGACNHCGQ